MSTAFNFPGKHLNNRNRKLKLKFEKLKKNNLKARIEEDLDVYGRLFGFP